MTPDDGNAYMEIERLVGACMDRIALRVEQANTELEKNLTELVIRALDG